MIHSEAACFIATVYTLHVEDHVPHSIACLDGMLAGVQVTAGLGFFICVQVI